MNDSAHTHSAAELQREIEADRQRIEEKLHEIQERMSPGELMDELLEYAKTSGGSEYLSNLGVALKSNPIPVALMGVSLAWLIANPASRAPRHEEQDDDYPLAPVRGSVRRVGPVESSFGERYSHFTDESGSRFRALTDDAGRRAGHFIDPAGKVYRGFADAAGKQIEDIRDETGALFDEASGWASRTWRQVSAAAGRMSASVTGAGRSFADSMQGAGRSLEEQGAQLNAAILRHFRDQPLVGGALAFAAGAAIGAALPHSEAEDAAMGGMAEDMRSNISARANAGVAQAMEAGQEILDKAGEAVLEAHDAAKDRLQRPVQE
ncbi:DUF3618 domain-containing protein [Sinorhizobium medicae]|uniref:Nutrient deprivation-induced protein n=2 Tax=Sinorhizobium medicae TaxID=110321 RepID=A0A508X1B5_9HYPH|nr:DUF3618 domain-containing protein [Sinorhizobium medicae]ABR62709.1 putative nutrient deprivation-induced protein [Sinorhizobium medicae WSM419]MBO1942403.1 DUF3618 domain-containing protein [Sinorhizobium medicae]MBO1961420.1 DUF3618 domain-containing protein [Sinorhizobium medicae]MDX0406738.1 DUF3618 domain-containing protein [Sinorhizobium medicae]MDX0412286.1 DUF3618 domain-containing protein [Sinorhizobium medicae]